MRALTPIRQTAEVRAELPDLRDVFLCHAWDDRQGEATDTPRADAKSEFDDVCRRLYYRLVKAVRITLCKKPSIRLWSDGPIAKRPIAFQRRPSPLRVEQSVARLIADSLQIPAEKIREMQPLFAERILMTFDSDPCFGFCDGDHPLYEEEWVFACSDINVWKRFSFVHALLYLSTRYPQMIGHLAVHGAYRIGGG